MEQKQFDDLTQPGIIVVEIPDNVDYNVVRDAVIKVAFCDPCKLPLLFIKQGVKIYRIPARSGDLIEFREMEEV